jgi:hypothetical protein
MKLREANAMLNGRINGRSNNSFNASGNSLDVIRKIGCFSQFGLRLTGYLSSSHKSTSRCSSSGSLKATERRIPCDVVTHLLAEVLFFPDA